MDNDPLSEKVIGCAFHIHNELGFGFLESVYEQAMLIELSAAGLRVAQQVPATVYYRNHVVGDFRIDLLVEDRLVVELKSIRALAPIHEMQVVNYLTATRIDVGLLINFGEQRVEVRRKYRRLPSGKEKTATG